MHEAVDLLEQAVATENPATVFAVTQRTLASATKVIARADDSSGIIGDACRRLLDLHPKTEAAAKVPAAKLVDWMIKFQFDGDVDYFVLDPVAYAPALGDKGIATYRANLDELRAGLGPEPTVDRRCSSPHSHEWLTLEWNAQRLAVLDHDIDAIIRSHARGRSQPSSVTSPSRRLRRSDRRSVTALARPCRTTAVTTGSDRFELSEEHEAVRASVRDLAEKEIAPPLGQFARVLGLLGAITDLAVIDVTPDGSKLVELAPGVTEDDVRKTTEPPLL